MVGVGAAVVVDGAVEVLGPDADGTGREAVAVGDEQPASVIRSAITPGPSRRTRPA